MTKKQIQIQIQLVMKYQKDPTYAVFLNSWWFNDIKNYIHKYGWFLMAFSGFWMVFGGFCLMLN